MSRRSMVFAYRWVRQRRVRNEQNQWWTSRQALPAGGDLGGDEKRSVRGQRALARFVN